MFIELESEKMRGIESLIFVVEVLFDFVHVQFVSEVLQRLKAPLQIVDEEDEENEH